MRNDKIWFISLGLFPWFCFVLLCSLKCSGVDTWKCKNNISNVNSVTDTLCSKHYTQYTCEPYRIGHLKFLTSVKILWIQELPHPPFELLVTRCSVDVHVYMMYMYILYSWLSVLNEDFVQHIIPTSSFFTLHVMLKPIGPHQTEFKHFD